MNKNIKYKSIGSYLNELNLIGEGAEIGTYGGTNIDRIFSDWGGKKIWCIDPYEVYSDMKYHTQKEFDNLYLSTKNRLFEKYKERVEIIRTYSVQAAEEFKDNQLDWVYIDGNHSKESVMEDLKSWYPKVKPGGLVFGDDYRKDLWPGVVKSVTEFFTNKHVVFFDDYPYFNDDVDNWYVIK